jgi:hypothetical protein
MHVQIVSGEPECWGTRLSTFWDARSHRPCGVRVWKVQHESVVTATKLLVVGSERMSDTSRGVCLG